MFCVVLGVDFGFMNYKTDIYSEYCFSSMQITCNSFTIKCTYIIVSPFKPIYPFEYYSYDFLILIITQTVFHCRVPGGVS